MYLFIYLFSIKFYYDQHHLQTFRFISGWTQYSLLLHAGLSILKNIFDLNPELVFKLEIAFYTRHNLPNFCNSAIIF